jgi:ribosomal protein S18 acetylase RimI-like enzyme
MSSHHRQHLADLPLRPPLPGLRVGSLRAGQLPAVGALFAGSHADYPPFRHLFPDPARRSAVLRAFFTATVRDAFAFGAVNAATGADGRLLGVAIWLPPGAFPWSAGRKLRSVPMLLSVLRTAPRGFPGFARLGANAERLHPRDRHWNLEAMGIAPAAQGQGIGSRLLAPGLCRADSQRLACYLTTARAENLKFYRRFGFEVEAEALQLVPGGPTHWAMRRPPAAGGGGGAVP